MTVRDSATRAAGLIPADVFLPDLNWCRLGVRRAGFIARPQWPEPAGSSHDCARSFRDFELPQRRHRQASRLNRSIVQAEFGGQAGVPARKNHARPTVAESCRNSTCAMSPWSPSPQTALSHSRHPCRHRKTQWERQPRSPSTSVSACRLARSFRHSSGYGSPLERLRFGRLRSSLPTGSATANSVFTAPVKDA
jgi:hypothetical protein